MPKKVMVVDDEEEMLDFIKTGLEIYDYEVFKTSTALDAIELAHNIKPDIIILDFVMPGIDGYSIYRGLCASKITMNIPVIFITGHMMTPEITAKILQTKAYCYLSKPFDIGDLVDRVKNALSAQIKTVKQ